MKKVLLILLWAAIINDSFAQDYKPLLTEGKVRECSDGYGNDYSIKVDGDIVVNGITMKKMVYADDN